MVDIERIEKIRASFLSQIEKMPEEQQAELKEQILRATPEELEQLAQSSSNNSGCIFCKIASGEIKTFKTYESVNVIAFLDINPASRGHMLIIPKKHVQYLFQLDNTTINEIFSLIKKLPAILKGSLNIEGLTTLFHQGKDQTVQHFSVSLFPRYKDDKLSFEQERKKADENELKSISIDISNRINNGEEEEKTNLVKEEKNKEIKNENIKKEISFFKKRIPR